MTFHICGQCAYFAREAHPEDEEQYGECFGFPPTPVVFEGEIITLSIYVDCGRQACAIFREARR